MKHIYHRLYDLRSRDVIEFTPSRNLDDSIEVYEPQTEPEREAWVIEYERAVQPLRFGRRT